MIAIFVILLGILSVGLVTCFCMIGVLGTRVDVSTTGELKELDVELGTRVHVWPEPLSILGRIGGHTNLLILSTICTTCNQLASEIGSIPIDTPIRNLGFVVSCKSEIEGTSFVATHDLGTYPVLVDEGGLWTDSTFGIRKSPVCLNLNEHQLLRAAVTPDINTLLKAIKE